MKILFCGDVMGQPGREAVKKHIPQLRKTHALDVVVINGENAANGYGITERILESFFDDGADVVTGGDHCFDQKETFHYISRQPRLLRVANLPDSVPGRGHAVFNIVGKKVLVIHLLGQLFTRFQVNCPFECASKILENYQLGKNVDAIIVDFHCEATSERTALGHYLDGRVSMVAGSHTHIPTADERILPKGTAYQTDTGMVGNYDSVIGFSKELAVSGFLHKVRHEKADVAKGEATLCGLLVETDDSNGLATSVKAIRIGGVLKQD
jgi:2',3'-cyclic-nucleotide 2'-phosphodiesterase